MKLITRKSEANKLLEICLLAYRQDGLDACVFHLNDQLLTKKVKFPILEYCGQTLFATIHEQEHIMLCDQIQALKTEGGNVLLGIILQKRLEDHFEEAIDKATEYIADADVWYVCDIIGERVYGFSLLHQPKKTIPVLKKLSQHKTNWVIRSLGAGTHYAIKKGLDRANVQVMFKILLTMANTSDKEIRQGVGWAAKTAAKFHPEIIQDFKDEIENVKLVSYWFRKKIEIGLNRNKYAKRN